MLPSFYLQEYQFADPLFLSLLLLLLLGLFFYLRFRPKHLSLGFSQRSFISSIPHGKFPLSSFPSLLRVIVLIVIVIALMNPQKILQQATNYKESVDIIIALDISSSMELEDLSPDRLTVAKEHIMEFVEKRNFDRIGLVVFGSEAFLQCPLTYDHDLLQQFIADITFLENISDQTAIGSAISSAVLALRSSEAKTKIIILLTDGDSNAGDISPLLAAEIAQKYGIKIYSVGIGKPGQSVVYRTINDPVYGKTKVPFATVLNEKDLEEISRLTGGHYFNVQSINNFTETYAEIDQLEKTNIRIEEYQFYQEKFHFWLQLALILLALELWLRETYLRRHPE